MRGRVIALAAVVVLLAGGVVLAVAVSGGDDDGDGAGGDVAAAVRPQLSFVDPGASLVAAVDMRYEGSNWGHLRSLASTVLREYRSEADAGERAAIPPNASGGLEMLARFAGLSFEDDIRPVLDGHLVVGVTFPPRKPLSRRLERLADVLDDAVYDFRRRAFVRIDPDAPFERPSRRTPLVRDVDGSRVTQREGQRYRDTVQRRDDAAEPSVVVVYRTRRGELRPLVRKVLDEARPRELEGYEDTVLLESNIALVGGDTLILTAGGAEGGGRADRPSRALRTALDRARAGRGYPARRLRAAQRQVRFDDPLVVAAATPTLARAAANIGLTNSLFDEADLDRARAEVPYLGAVRRLAAAIDLDEESATGRLHMTSDARHLRGGDVPLASAGGLELPQSRLVGSATRDQSVTTAFAAGVARSLFSESDFVRAVERTERRLRIRFEDEVLRQFDCPSVTVFDAARARFGARSCLRDPDRMRALLPRLRPHLPRIVRALQNLGDRGMLALLLVAPDAPATPLLQLAQVDVTPVRPRGGSGGRELLYEMGGLHDGVRNPAALAGPARVVFGMIGDTFVVASDRALARRMPKLPTRRHEEPVATAIRIPGSQLLAGSGGVVTRIAGRVLDALVLSASADRSAFRGKGELSFER